MALVSPALQLAHRPSALAPKLSFANFLGFDLMPYAGDYEDYYHNRRYKQLLCVKFSDDYSSFLLLLLLIIVIILF